MDLTFTSIVAPPIGLGLVGSIEPCSIGSTLLFVKYLEGKDRGRKLVQVPAFTGARALFIGALGALATVVGSAFLGFQRGAWVLLSAVYLLIGLLFLIGKSGVLAVALGPTLASLSGVRGSLALFGLALSLPLVAAVLFEPARRALDWLAGLSRRGSALDRSALIALGLWSIWFGLFAIAPA